MASSRLRGRIAIITSFWGEDEDEQISVIRLAAGALARQLHVDVIHLDTTATTQRTRNESAFVVHTIPLTPTHPAQDLLLRLALNNDGGSPDLPPHLEATVDAHQGALEAVNECIDRIDPDAIVLCGTVHPYDLSRLRGYKGRRIVFMPVSPNMLSLHDRAVTRIMQISDLVVVTHPGEERTLRQIAPERARAIVPLDLGLSVNRGATNDTLFGVRFFQPFVLLIRSFGKGEDRLDRVVTHEIVTSVMGPVRREDIPKENWRYTDDDVPEELPISVAEVDGENWRLSDNINMLPLPVSPNRVNLWRLMAHALFMIDLRPSSAFGRETLESLMFETPVIVPDFSAAKEHAQAANAGLWYRNNGEILDCVRVLGDRTIREQFATNGRTYTDRHHSDLVAFVDRICELVLPHAGAS